MLCTDGTYTIYRIQHKGKLGSREWYYSSFDFFGTPPGFSAADPCWQQTGVFGTFSRSVALKGLAWIRKAKRYDWRDNAKVTNTDTEFRLVMIEISQRTVSLMSATPEPAPPRQGRKAKV